MDTKSQRSWSKQLKLQTREAIQELPIYPDGNLHFKHVTLGFAKASLIDLLDGRIVLHNKEKLMVYYFDNVNCLIEAGWAID